jgi:Secretion system C-terminal sorting domain
MKKYILLILSVYSLTASLFSQTYFNRVYDYDNTNTFNNAASCVVELNDGNFILGTIKFPSVNKGALHFIKINNFGDTIVSKRFPTNYRYYFTGPSNSLFICNDNNLVQCGKYYDSASIYFDGLLVKLNQNGDTLWTKKYGGSSYDQFNAVAQTPDSGFVLMGVTQSFSNGPASDFYLVKTDKYGNQQWQQTYGTTLAEDCVSGQITLDGGFVMAGQKNINGTDLRFYVVKTNPLGNLQWQKTYNTSAGAGFIKQLEDSTYIIAGAKPFGSTYKPSLIKTDKNGNLLWQKDYGSTYGSLFYAVPIILNDGSIVVSGLYLAPNAHGYGLLIKTDSAGNELWTRTYYANPNNDNYVYDVKHTSDGGFILTGSGSVTGQDAWVVKVDSLGCEVAGCAVGIEELEIMNYELEIYPNPASNNLTIKQFGNLTIEAVNIYNTLGECVQHSPLLRRGAGGEVSFDLSPLPSGIYFLTCMLKDKTVTKKFIVAH